MPGIGVAGEQAPMHRWSWVYIFYILRLVLHIVIIHYYNFMFIMQSTFYNFIYNVMSLMNQTFCNLFLIHSFKMLEYLQNFAWLIKSGDNVILYPLVTLRFQIKVTRIQIEYTAKHGIFISQVLNIHVNILEWQDFHILPFHYY